MKLKWLVGIFCAILLLSILSACTRLEQEKSSSNNVVKTSSTESDESSVPEQGYHKISQEKAKKMIDEGSVTIVDVRTAEEYQEKRIPDAVLVPNEIIGSAQPEALPDLEAVLLVYCRTGVRSKQASDKLVKIGYTSVYNIGGITTWPYDTIEGN